MIAARLDPGLKLNKAISIPDMQWPFIVSILFHALIVVGFTVGFPYVKKEQLIISPPVSVEIVNIDLITQTDKIAPPKKVEKPPEPKPEESKPAPAKMTAEAPPDLTQPKAPDVPDLVPEPEEIKEPEPLKRKEIKKPPKVKPKPKVTKAPPKKKENDFASLLKNLTPDAKKEASKEKTENPVEDNPASGQIARLSDVMTISEQDALRRQLAGCWNVMAGAKYAEDLVVGVRVFMNPDRTVNRASILDKGRYNRDSHFRAAADAAIRALRNPRCSPLELPPDKFEQWQTILINFDPRDML